MCERESVRACSVLLGQADRSQRFVIGFRFFVGKTVRGAVFQNEVCNAKRRFFLASGLFNYGVF